jgi:hypothetical protein
LAFNFEAKEGDFLIIFQFTVINSSHFLFTFTEKEKWEDCRKTLDKALWETPLNVLKEVLDAFEKKNLKSLYDEMWKLDGDKAYVYRAMCESLLWVTFEVYVAEFNIGSVKDNCYRESLQYCVKSTRNTVQQTSRYLTKFVALAISSR